MDVQYIKLRLPGKVFIRPQEPSARGAYYAIATHLGMSQRFNSDQVFSTIQSPLITKIMIRKKVSVRMSVCPDVRTTSYNSKSSYPNRLKLPRIVNIVYIYRFRTILYQKFEASHFWDKKCILRMSPPNIKNAFTLTIMGQNGFHMIHVSHLMKNNNFVPFL